MASLPHIKLINLDRSSDRLDRFREWNGHLENVTRFSGADGLKLDRAELVRSGYIADDLSYGAGTLGCAISHLRLWELAVRENRSITIFEDDVVVAHCFEDMASRAMSDLPANWDFIKWGFSINPLYAWLDVGVSRVRLEGYGEPAPQDAASLRTFQRRENVGGPVRMLHSFALFAYSISAKGARTLLEYCLPLRNRLIEFPDAGVICDATGIDVLVNGAFPQMQAFMFLPHLIGRYDQDDSVRKTLDRI
jgi:GR25 family glycosyltransferase involved in LPS biosynthesis